jgi:hypothetical protein
MRDAVLASAEQLASQWQSEAKSRRRFTPADPVADALDVCASELQAELARVADATRLLTVEQYARTHGMSESTVRRSCARGELAGEKNGAGEWMIPRDARRTAPVARVG